MSVNKTYPSHEEFMEKLRRLDDVGLVATLKRLSFLAQTKVYLLWKKET